MNPSRLELFVPGLLPPASWLYGVEVPEVPALESLLGRATFRSHIALSHEAQLFALFGAAPPPPRLPVAELTYAIDLPHETATHCIRADPIYLRADLHQLLVFDGRSFELSPADADALITEINAELRQLEHDLELVRGESTTRWYLRLAELPDIETTSPLEVVGKHADPYLPSGNDARWWHGLANELQMALHTSATNARRAERGLVPINSLWFWGNGTLGASQQPPIDRVVADDIVAEGLALWSNTTFRRLADTSAHSELAVAGELLVVNTGLADALAMGDRGAWGAQLIQLNNDWLGSVISAFLSGQLNSIRLYVGPGTFSLNRLDRWKIWRRRKPITHYLGASQHQVVT